MIGGPETGLTPNVDEIVNSGLAASGLGAGTDTSTVGAPGVPKPMNPMDPGVSQTGRGLNVTVENPQWATPPSQADFGQVGPYRDQHDTGLVVIAQQQMPFAALANRQMGLNQRKAALEKQLADFDLYSNVGKAADPYQRNFGQMARADMDRFVDEIAASYGGDRKDAMRRIVSDPELKARWRDRGAKWEEVGQTSQYLFKDAQTRLLQAEMGEVEMDADERQAAQDLVMGLGQFGSDGQPDVHKQVEMGRRYEAVVSRNKYFKEYIAPGIAATVQTLQAQGKFNRANGALILTETEKKNWDGQIDQESRRMAAMGMGSKEEMEKYLRGKLPSSEVVSTEYKMLPTSGGGSGSGVAGQTGYSAQYNPVRPAANKLVADNLRAAGANIPEGANRIDQVTLFDVTSGKGKFPAPRQTGDGDYIHPTGVFRDQSGKLWIYGKEAREPSTTSQGAYRADSDERDEAPTVEEFNRLKDVVKPYEDNAGIISGAFPGLTRGELVRIIDEGVAGLPKRGAVVEETVTITPEQFNAQWSKLPKGGKLMGPDGVEYTKK